MPATLVCFPLHISYTHIHIYELPHVQGSVCQGLIQKFLPRPSSSRENIQNKITILKPTSGRVYKIIRRSHIIISWQLMKGLAFRHCRFQIFQQTNIHKDKDMCIWISCIHLWFFWTKFILLICLPMNYRLWCIFIQLTQSQSQFILGCCNVWQTDISATPGHQCFTDVYGCLTIMFSNCSRLDVDLAVGPLSNII